MNSLAINPKAGGFREVWTLAYPVIITMASMSVMGLVDTFFMGWVGTPQQGAVGFGAVLSWTCMSFFNGTFTATTTFVAQFVGSKQYDQCARLVWQTLYAALAGALLIVTILVPNIDRLLELAGTEPEVIGFTASYMAIRLSGGIFVFIGFSIIGFLRGIGDTKTPMKVTLFINALNIGITYLLVFGKLGFPVLGIQGAAIGTVLSQAVGSGIYLGIFLKNDSQKTYRTRASFGFDWLLMKRFLWVGLPIGVWWILQMGGFAVFSAFVATLGPAPLAAHNIVRQMLHLSYLPGVALSVSATALVGKYLGAKDPKSAVQSAQTAMKIAMIIMGSLSVLFLLFRHWIASAFAHSDPLVVDIASHLFLFAVFYQTLDAVVTVSSGVLRGAGDTRWPMLISIVTSWLIFVPGIFLLGRFFGFGIYGAWTSAAIYVWILAFLLFGRFRSGKWKSMQI